MRNQIFGLDQILFPPSPYCPLIIIYNPFNLSGGLMRVNAAQLFCNTILLLIKIICGLKTKPKPCLVAEIPFEPERCIRGDASFPFDNLIDSSRGDVDVFSKPVLADTEWLKKIFFEEYTRVLYGNAVVVCTGHNLYLLVIVTEFGVTGLAAFPVEANAPLFVNSDAILPRSVTCELFKLVTRGRFQVVLFSQINLNKPLPGSYCNLVGNGFNVLTIKDTFSGLVCERFYHRIIVMPSAINVKRY